MKTTDISNRDLDQPAAQKKQQFNFPAHGITVEAESLEEAKKLLDKQLNKE